MVSVKMLSRLGHLHPSSTKLFICDIQGAFKEKAVAMNSVIGVSKLMISVAKTLDIPVIVTEQYPRGLGKTVPEIDISGAKLFEKTLFSMAIPPVIEELKDTKSVVLCGLESHVCVLQTTLDLLERGIDVHVLMDGTSSMRQYNRLAAFQRLRASGAVVTTSESVIFQLVKDASHPKFKEISNLVKSFSALQLNPELPESL
uniref:Isochorismatase-like domain-containing protein n=1 Tax=Arcella intermedia TaxID=1963864 RepID=A0A6B2LJ63_9EUKA